MVFTTVLFAVVARRLWRWSVPAVVALAGLFLVVDLAFWGANLPKIPGGGWFPLVVAAARVHRDDDLEAGPRGARGAPGRGRAPVRDVRRRPRARVTLPRVPGTAVFLSGDYDRTPTALLHNIKHNHCLHEHVVQVTVETEEIPTVDDSDRATVESLGQGVWRVRLRYGFTETPDVPAALAAVATPELPFPPMRTSYFVGRERVLSTARRGMGRQREKLFASISNNARSATAFFGLPPNRVVEMGAQVEI